MKVKHEMKSIIITRQSLTHAVGNVGLHIHGKVDDHWNWWLTKVPWL